MYTHNGLLVDAHVFREISVVLQESTTDAGRRKEKTYQTRLRGGARAKRNGARGGGKCARGAAGAAIDAEGD